MDPTKGGMPLKGVMQKNLVCVHDGVSCLCLSVVTRLGYAVLRGFSGVFCGFPCSRAGVACGWNARFHRPISPVMRWPCADRAGFLFPHQGGDRITSGGLPRQCEFVLAWRWIDGFAAISKTSCCDAFLLRRVEHCRLPCPYKMDL